MSDGTRVCMAVIGLVMFYAGISVAGYITKGWGGALFALAIVVGISGFLLIAGAITAE